MKIVLLGYMGSGKSTVGLALSEQFNFNFVDLDAYIERKENLSIAEIFKVKGEIYFRKTEALHIRNLINNSDYEVIALGGGTPCYAETMPFFKANPATVTIYLQTSVYELTNRLFKNKEKRPLIKQLQTKDALAEYIGKHMFERNYFYNSSDFIIKTDNKSIDNIVEDIATITNLRRP